MWVHLRLGNRRDSDTTYRLNKTLYKQEIYIYKQQEQHRAEAREGYDCDARRESQPSASHSSAML